MTTGSWPPDMANSQAYSPLCNPGAQDDSRSSRVYRETEKFNLNSRDNADCRESGGYACVELLEPFIPAAKPEHSRVKTWRRWIARRKVVLWGCFSATSVVCLTNSTVAIWAWLHYERTQDGIVELFRGNCSVVKRADTGAHVVINILGTLLLSASNLTLQLLVAPTREEVDKAHARGDWFDIGVPSYRNLKGISKLKTTLWCLLGLSSIPIHFL